MPRCNGNPVADTNGTGPSVEGAGDVTDESVVGGSVGDGNMKSTGLESENGTQGFVDEYDPEAEDTKGAGALKTSLWELAALQNHYHPAVATLVSTKRRGLSLDTALLFGSFGLYRTFPVLLRVTSVLHWYL